MDWLVSCRSRDIREQVGEVDRGDETDDETVIGLFGNVRLVSVCIDERRVCRHP